MDSLLSDLVYISMKYIINHSFQYKVSRNRFLDFFSNFIITILNAYLRYLFHFPCLLLTNEGDFSMNVISF